MIIKNMVLLIMLIMAMITIVIVISKKSFNSMEKSSPFECGFDPMSKKRLPFSVSFFFIAVIFLIFDIEIVLVMPMILTLKSTSLLSWMISTTTFLFILIMGLYHEWYNGMINWTN